MKEIDMKHAITAAAAALSMALPAIAAADTAGNDPSIRPFHIRVPDADLDDLRKRIVATRWPDKETVTDSSQGAQLAKLQELVRYWGTDYDWRKAEARLNDLPQYVTTIDGVDIHFIWVRSRHPDALPLLLTHGWPGSVFEFTGVVGPLTDPTAHGGDPSDAFDVVIPSIPGYGFSSIPTTTGWDPDRIARAFEELMSRLGYTRYVAQGGDWGASVTTAMAHHAPAGLRGVHISLPATIPPEVAAALAARAPAPAGLSEEERATYEALSAFAKKGDNAYLTMLGARPQTIGYGATDSPAFHAAFLLGHPGFAQWKFGADPQQSPTKDEVLDDFTLYWVTNSATSAGRLYWENMGRSPLLSSVQKTTEIKLPVAITVFPEDVYFPPESWARRAYPTLTYFHRAEKGGHFASWEQPQLFSEELRAAFRTMR